MFLPWAWSTWKAIIWGENKLGDQPTEKTSLEGGSLPDRRSFLPSGGLCYPWSAINRHPCHRLVPGAVHSSPEADQLHTGPEDAHFWLEPQAAGDAEGRKAADGRPLQVNGRAFRSCPDPRLREGLWKSRAAPSVMASITREETKPHHSLALEQCFPETIPSVIAQNGHIINKQVFLLLCKAHSICFVFFHWDLSGEAGIL